jgi:hypothetical protein
MNKKIILLVLLFFALFSSCKKDPTSWDAQLLAPLVSTTLDINNLLTGSVVQANADSSLKIVYQNDFYTLSMDTLFKIPDTTVHQPYAIPFQNTFSPGQEVISNSLSETTYNLPQAQLRTTIVKSGSVLYSIKSFIKGVTDFVYKIPCATLTGVPFTINISVPAAVGNAPGIYSKTFDLSGYTIDLTGIYNNKVNTIYTSLTASISPLGQPVLVLPTDSLIINNTFHDIIPSYAKGYFGQNTFNIGPSETNFDLFKKIVGGTVHLEDVNFNLKIENPIGLDARVFINNLSSMNTRTGTTIALSNSIVGSPININRASENGGNVSPTIANYPLTTANSNIKQLVENLPDKFGYSMQIVSNPLGNISNSNDFIYSDKLMTANLDMEIPLSLVANDLTLADTLALNISNNGTQSVKSGTVTLFVDNGFPFEASLQFYLLNDANNVVDSLFANANTFDEAPVNSNYRATGKKLTKIIIPVGVSKMNLLYNTKKLKLKVKFNTAAKPNYIKIYSDYKMDVKLVGDFDYTVQLK